MVFKTPNMHPDSPGDEMLSSRLRPASSAQASEVVVVATRRSTSRTLAVFWQVFVAMCGLSDIWVRADDGLTYAKRGNWSEGIKSAPVSGFDLVLVGAATIPKEDCRKKGPDHATLAIRTKMTGALSPAVREQVSVYNYWLDEVNPVALKPGGVPTESVLRWPVGPVLARLQQIELSNLIPIVRVGTNVPSIHDRVALGVICTEGSPSSSLNGYLFQFGLRSDSKVSMTISKESGDVVWQQAARTHRGGLPLRVFWKPEALPQGRYELLVSSISETTSALVEYRVTFDHLW